jgi:hypothetical protein
VVLLLEGAHQPDIALGLEVEIEIEQELDLVARTVAEGPELPVECLLDAERRIELWSSGRANESGM